MDNPFAALKKSAAPEEPQAAAPVAAELSEAQRQQIRASLYAQYTPLVREVLQMLAEALAPGVWQVGDDQAKQYCCHVGWFAGPPELLRDNLDPRHEVRRRIEVTLDLDSFCNPLGFRVMDHSRSQVAAHTGLAREDLIAGIQQVLA